MYCILCVDLNTSLRSLLSQRNTGPSFLTPEDRQLCQLNVTNTVPSTPKKSCFCEMLCPGIAQENHVRRVPTMAIHVISHDVHRSREKYLRRRFRAAVLLYHWS